jgi:hypothetical protein
MASRNLNRALAVGVLLSLASATVSLRMVNGMPMPTPMPRSRAAASAAARHEQTRRPIPQRMLPTRPLKPNATPPKQRVRPTPTPTPKRTPPKERVRRPTPTPKPRGTPPKERVRTPTPTPKPTGTPTSTEAVGRPTPTPTEGVGTPTPTPGIGGGGSRGGSSPGDHQPPQPTNPVWVPPPRIYLPQPPGWSHSPVPPPPLPSESRPLRSPVPGRSVEQRALPSPAQEESPSAAPSETSPPGVKRFFDAQTGNYWSYDNGQWRSYSYSNENAMRALELAGWSAERRRHYDDALQYLRRAQSLTNQKSNPEEWGRIQTGIARVLFAKER